MNREEANDVPRPGTVDGGAAEKERPPRPVGCHLILFCCSLRGRVVIAWRGTRTRRNAISRSILLQPRRCQIFQLDHVLASFWLTGVSSGYNLG